MPPAHSLFHFSSLFFLSNGEKAGFSLQCSHANIFPNLIKINGKRKLHRKPSVAELLGRILCVSWISLGETDQRFLEINLKEQLQENQTTYETLEKKVWVSKMAHGVKVSVAKSDNQSSVSGYHMMAGGTKSETVFRPP